MRSGHVSQSLLEGASKVIQKKTAPGAMRLRCCYKVSPTFPHRALPPALTHPTSPLPPPDNPLLYSRRQNGFSICEISSFYSGMSRFHFHFCFCLIIVSLVIYVFHFPIHFIMSYLIPFLLSHPMHPAQSPSQRLPLPVPLNGAIERWLLRRLHQRRPEKITAANIQASNHGC